MNTRQKLERIIARNPELKDTIKSLQDDRVNQQLHSIVEKDIDKVILIGKDAEKIARLFELASLIKRGYVHITQVTTPQLLDAYVSDETPSLTTIVDDIVMIKDCRAYVPNKQKSNMIMQVFEQNESVIYYYVGHQVTYDSEHAELTRYARESGIKLIKAEPPATKVSLKHQGDSKGSTRKDLI